MELIFCGFIKALKEAPDWVNRPDQGICYQGKITLLKIGETKTI